MTDDAVAVRWFRDIGAEHVAEVGGKNASLGEMLRSLEVLGVQVPDGFAVTADAYRAFLRHNQLEGLIQSELAGGPDRTVTDLEARSQRIRAAFLRAQLPPDVAIEVGRAYRSLCGAEGELHVAVRSSATAEDLPTASFAGQQESYLYVQGEVELLEKVRRCYASLFSPRSIHYREDMGFSHDAVALSVGVQRLVRADTAASGVVFTLEPESGHRDIVYVTSAHGLGENVVQGRVEPDAFWVHKPTLATGHASLVRRKLGKKELRLHYDAHAHRLLNDPTSPAEQRASSLSDHDVLQLARL